MDVYLIFGSLYLKGIDLKHWNHGQFLLPSHSQEKKKHLKNISWKGHNSIFALIAPSWLTKVSA